MDSDNRAELPEKRILNRYQRLSEIVAQQIVDWIVSGTIKPGQRLVPDDIASKLGVSRSPVREALRILEEGGFLESAPYRGPPFTSLWAATASLKSSPIMVGAQNMHWAEAGAYTGEISAAMIKECGCQLVEIGHSERRRYFGETDETVNLKMKAALGAGLRPILCIGETFEEKMRGDFEQVLFTQIERAFTCVSIEQIPNTIIAYEPVWAIGTGVPAQAAYVNEIHLNLRNQIARLWGEGIAQRISIIYGGSVDVQSTPELIAQPEIDGVFVGTCAWQAKNFRKIVEIVCAARGEE